MALYWDARTINTVVTAVDQKKASVLLTKTWLAIHEDMDVGVIKGTRLNLARTDRERLRKRLELFNMESGLGSVKTRTELAAITGNEKLNRTSVFSDRIKVGVLSGGSLHLKQGRCELPQGVYVECAASDIMLDTHAIVFVENGEVLYSWQPSHKLVQDIGEGALVVYRGHTNAAAMVISLLESAKKAGLECYGFVDYDVPGLKILSDLRHVLTKAVLPNEEGLISLFERRPYLNKSSEVSTQLNRYPNLLNSLPTPLKPSYTTILSHKWSVTQECLIANNIELQICALS